MNGKNENQFTGIWIPADIWRQDKLTLLEKVMLSEITALNNENGCFASNSYFAEFFKMSQKNISKTISNLIKKGFLTSKIEYKKGSKLVEKRILKVCDTSPQNEGYPIPKMKDTLPPKLGIPSPQNEGYPPPENVQDIVNNDNKDYSKYDTLSLNSESEKNDFHNMIKNASDEEKLKMIQQSYRVYLIACKKNFNELNNDTNFIAQQEYLNPNVDVKKSLLKSYNNFYGTMEGWDNVKDKIKKSGRIDWKTIIANAINRNRVFQEVKKQGLTEALKNW